MLQLLCVCLLLTSAYPLGRAWGANRGTTLRHALLWAWAAYLAWLGAVVGGLLWPSWGGPLGRYLALSLTGCAGVAVLGARQPGVQAWNFVVAGLAAVLLLPVAEGFGTPRLNTVYLAFLGATLAVGLLNYLPTALAPAVLALAAACAVELAGLAKVVVPDYGMMVGRCLLALTPWLALARRSWQGQAETEFDRTWLAFRNRYGVVWGQRTREQFNRAAANAGWPVVLSWHGLQPLGEGACYDPQQALATLQALLKRFEVRSADK